MIKRIRSDNSLISNSSNDDDNTMLYEFYNPCYVPTEATLSSCCYNVTNNSKRCKIFDGTQEQQHKQHKQQQQQTQTQTTTTSATAREKQKSVRFCFIDETTCTCTCTATTTSCHENNDNSESMIVRMKPSLDHFDTIMEWMSTLWYNRTELNQFRTEARDISKQIASIRSVPISSPASSSNSMDGIKQQPQQPQQEESCKKEEPNLAFDSYTRGLEIRWCKERQRRRYVATKFILKAASIIRREQAAVVVDVNDVTDVPNSSNNTTETVEHKLASIAKRCNAYATKIAIEEGYYDYQRACCCTDNDDSNDNEDLDTSFWNAMLY